MKVLIYLEFYRNRWLIALGFLALLIAVGMGSGSTPHALIKFSTLFLIVVGYEQVKTVLMHCFIFGEGQRFSHKST